MKFSVISASQPVVGIPGRADSATNPPPTVNARPLAVMHHDLLSFFKNIFSKKKQDKKILLKFELDDGKIYEEKIKLDQLEERVFDLQKHFHQPKSLSEISYIFCLVGNIVEERYNKSQDKLFKGTKHFSSGTKVYCYPPIWGDGFANIKVIGKHRKSSKLITIVLPSKYVTNWRLQKVYNPFVIREMTENYGWTDKESDKEQINKMLVSLTSH